MCIWKLSQQVTKKCFPPICSHILSLFSQQRYVQDVLRDHPWLVYSTICRRNGHVFVSGDVTMATEVRITVEAILSQYGRMSMVDAQNYVTRMKVSESFKGERDFYWLACLTKINFIIS